MDGEASKLNLRNFAVFQLLKTQKKKSIGCFTANVQRRPSYPSASISGVRSVVKTCGLVVKRAPLARRYVVIDTFVKSLRF